MIPLTLIFYVVLTVNNSEKVYNKRSTRYYNSQWICGIIFFLVDYITRDHTRGSTSQEGYPDIINPVRITLAVEKSNNQVHIFLTHTSSNQTECLVNLF
jgi:hypothetical protein